MDTKIKWEYRVDTIGSVLKGLKDEEIEVVLNDWGEAGWEIISARPPTNSPKITIIAKRQQTLESRRQRRLEQREW